MRLDLLLDSLDAELTQDRVLLRRVTTFFLPLLLLPAGIALGQMPFSMIGLGIGGLLLLVLLVQITLTLKPIGVRARTSATDVSYYVGSVTSTTPSMAPVAPLLIPAAVALSLGLLAVLSAVPPGTANWRRLMAVVLALGVLVLIWQEITRVVAALAQLETQITAGRQSLRLMRTELPAPTRGEPWARSWARLIYRAPVGISAPATHTAPPGLRRPAPHGLLDPDIARQIAKLPTPSQRLSPAALALLRIEAYLLLRDNPGRDEYDLIESLADLSREAYAAELRHWSLPPIGGKIYLPIATGGLLARRLRATVHALGMDGAYSATLGTWLVRLPPARSYTVAGQLIDSVLALRLLPPDLVLPHHLTVQGDLGPQARLISFTHLVATPLVFAQRPGHARGDERPFLMRGGGVLDDMDGRGRRSGPRTDFVDGFLIPGLPNMRAVEHVVAHTINLRVKQVLAFGLLAQNVPRARRTPHEQSAADAFGRFQAEVQAFAETYGLAGALEVDWFDGAWSAVWPFIERMGQLKEQDGRFLDDAQEIRDRALDALEPIAIEGARR